MKTMIAVSTFIVFAVGLAWLLALPLWLDRGLQNPWFLLLSIAIMFTPAIAAVMVGKIFEPQTRLVETLGIRPQGVSVRNVMFYGLAAIGLAVGVIVGDLFIGHWLGVYTLDLTDFSGFHALITSRLEGRPLPASLPPLPLLAGIQIIVVVLAAPVNAIAAVGEELGWRGWLLPRLLPLGLVPAIVISGIVWGVWHAPLILLGYNYPDAPGWLAIGCMCGMCVAIGGVLSWLRLRARSIWPSALGHGAVNAAAGLYLILGKAGEKINLTQATILGWTGWILPVVISVLLFIIFPVWPARKAADFRP